MWKRWSCLALLLLTMACAGTEADLERASYLLARGDFQSAEKAAEILEPLLESERSVQTRMKAGRLYVGAQATRAGFAGIPMVAKIVHREDTDEDDTLKVLMEALEGESTAEEAKEYLEAAVERLDAIIEDEEFQELGADDTDKLRLYYARGQAHFFNALRIGIRDSGLLDFADGEFDPVEHCELDTTEQADAFIEALLNARKNYSGYEAADIEVGAGFDDTEVSSVSEDHPLVGFVDSIQESLVEKGVISSKLDTEIDTPAQLDQLCEYIGDQSG